jgi:hypothetical protein
VRVIRLTRKLAESVNGFNLSNIDVGDVLELPDQTADMLLAERWAEPLPPDRPTSSGSSRTRKPK